MLKRAWHQGRILYSLLFCPDIHMTPDGDSKGMSSIGVGQTRTVIIISDVWGIKDSKGDC
jgi:hypothetical protein